MAGVDDLFLGHTTFDGRTVPFVLKLTPFSDLAWFLKGPPRTPTQERDWVVGRLVFELAAFDGQPVTSAVTTRLLGHPHLLGDIISARNRLYDQARQQGRMFALCPGCKVTESELSFLHLVLRLGMTTPPLTTPDGIWLPPPAIAGDLRRGARRGDLPMAHRIRFELPSARMGLGAPARPSGGVMSLLDHESERSAWSRFWPEGSEAPEERTWWRPESASFRALIRLSAALAGFDRGEAPSPASLEALPAVDVDYLQLAVIAAQFTDEPPDRKPAPGLVPRPRNLPVTCSGCGVRYLPLL